MPPLRRLAVGLWIAVFLLAGLWLGAAWRRPAEISSVNTTDNTTVNPDDNLQETDFKNKNQPAVGIGDPVPALRLKDLKGETRSLGEWSGRTLLLNFWATWCAPCRKEMPLLEQFQQSQDPGRLQVVGIAIDRLEPVLRFLGETGVTYPNLVGEMDATRAAELFAPDFALPLSVLVDAGGKVLWTHMGEIRPSHLEPMAALAAGTITPEEALARLRN